MTTSNPTSDVDILSELAAAEAKPAEKTQPAPPPPAARAASESGGETSFDDTSVTAQRFKTYKGRKDVKDRIAILNVAAVQWERVHYTEEGGKKGYILCASKFKKIAGQGEVMDGPPAICCKRLDESKKRFGVLVCHYNTNPEGDPTAPLSYELKLWKIGDTQFVRLRDSHNEFKLDQIDLMVRCTDEQFQKLEITPSSKRIISLDRFPQKHKDEIAAWVQAMIPQIKRELGRKLSEQELLTRLGMATSSKTVVSEKAIENLDDLLPND